MRMRSAVCVVLSVWVLAANSRALAQPPAAACRPECEAARLAWVAADDDLKRAAREDNEATLEVVLRKWRISTVEGELKSENGAKAQAALALELDGLRVALDQAEREAKEAGAKHSRALYVAFEARVAYQECCAAKQDKSGLPAWTYVAAGVGGAVAIGSTIGSDSAVTGGSASPAPPTAGTPTTSNPPAQPAPQPAPPAQPTPPAMPTPADGRVAVEGQTYQVRFSNSNVDQTVNAMFAQDNSTCLDGFFRSQFISPIAISGTGPFSPPALEITGSGTTSFLIGAETIRGELTISLLGSTMRVTLRYDRPRCYVVYIAQVAVSGF